ncbi:MAG: winged helix-turn-helix transcriptional regulator [Anaerolineae bacterium]|nr:winged helix-turn-helix transcriptional regulator [Anaerolineae bacterium]
MSEINLVAPPKSVTVKFSLAPAYNALASLTLLGASIDFPNRWLQETAVQFTPEQLEHNKRLCSFAMLYLDGKEWASFPAFLDHLQTRDMTELRDKELNFLLADATKQFPDRHWPTCEQLLTSQDAFVGFFEQLCALKGEECPKYAVEANCELFQDPEGKKETILAHLRRMWRDHLAEEWERNLPMLRESIAALESLDYTGKSFDVIIKLVTDRDLPAPWEHLGETDEIVFIPSPHIAPYLMQIAFNKGPQRIFFGARIPEGAAARSPALSRSELLTRLSALADDTRLRILQFLAVEGEKSAAEITDRLGLSQSSASRHLSQLSATNYLLERRKEGAKHYSLNPERIDDTFGALKSFVK